MSGSLHYIVVVCILVYQGRGELVIIALLSLITDFIFLTDRVMAEEELKTNMAETEVFVLPSGQQIEKEGLICVQCICI